jgi:hypothetical protein
MLQLHVSEALHAVVESVCNSHPPFRDEGGGIELLVGWNSDPLVERNYMKIKIRYGTSQFAIDGKIFIIYK